MRRCTPIPTELALVSKVGARRDDTGAWQPAQAPDELRADIEDNLRTLDIDRLAAVNLRIHAGDPSSVGPVDRELFERQLTAMIKARDEGLIAGIGLSSIDLEHLKIALDRTEIVCVQNAYNLVDRTSQPVLDACIEHDIAFVPFFPLGSGFTADNPVLGHPAVQSEAAKLGRTPAQIALAWTLSFAPNVLLIPGTSSVKHLEENTAVAEIELDDETRRELDAAPDCDFVHVLLRASRLNVHEITRRRPSPACAAPPSANPHSRQARWSSLHAGVQRLSSCQLARRSSGLSQNPTASPAA